MKGNISLREFIKEVKEDLRSAVDDNDPFFTMDEVELEVSFGLDIEAKAGAKFVVFDLSSKAKAQQSHKVKLKLTPFVSEVSKIDDSADLKKALKSKNKSPILDGNVEVVINSPKAVLTKKVVAPKVRPKMNRPTASASKSKTSVKKAPIGRPKKRS